MKTVLASLDQLLKRPGQLHEAPRSPAPRLLAGSLLLLALYGASAGFFQGGAQIAVAAVKGPLIVLAALLLCAPSLYVFSALAGADLTPRRFGVALSGFGAMIALVLVGLVPVSWLFSVSSRSLLFVTWLHLLAFLVAVAFAGRFLAGALEERGVGALLLWGSMFLFVTFQVATVLRPVLWRAPGGPLLEGGKRFFTEQLEETGRADRAAR